MNSLCFVVCQSVSNLLFLTLALAFSMYVLESSTIFINQILIDQIVGFENQLLSNYFDCFSSSLILSLIN